MSCQALLQGIVPTQRSNLGLPHCRQIRCCLSYQESPWAQHRGTHMPPPKGTVRSTKVKLQHQAPTPTVHPSCGLAPTPSGVALGAGSQPGPEGEVQEAEGSEHGHESWGRQITETLRSVSPKTPVTPKLSHIRRDDPGQCLFGNWPKAKEGSPAGPSPLLRRPASRPKPCNPWLRAASSQP